MADDKDKQAERLKRARELMAQRGGDLPVPVAAPAVPAPTAAAAAPPPHGDAGGNRWAGLLDILTNLLKPKPVAPPAPVQSATGVEPPPFTVVVAALGGDADGAAATFLNRTLTERPALKVKALGRVFQLDTLEDPSLVSSVVLNTRHAVAEENADLLIWGDVGRDGYRLRLATVNADEERTAAFGATTRIELPAEFGEPVANLLFAAILTAIDPASDAQKVAIKRLLPAAATTAEVLASRPPVQMTMPQQRSIQLVFGHVATATALAGPADQMVPWFDKAVNAYRQAQRRLGRTDPSWEAGLLHKHLAAVFAARAERDTEPAPLWEEAIKEWRSAAEVLPRALMPQEWAAAQVRLGVALYRLDLLTGQTELLREAVQALQAAMQVYSRTETPQRWAEVMHNVAQVLEVYGDQLKSAEVLKRAIDACRAVLDIRTRERGPLAWATTQNTLGSALFMLDRHTNGASHLEEAQEVLAAALEVFQAHGAKGPAKVASKNLSHVRRLIETHKSRKVADPHWLDEPEGK